MQIRCGVANLSLKALFIRRLRTLLPHLDLASRETNQLSVARKSYNCDQLAFLFTTSIREQVHPFSM